MTWEWAADASPATRTLALRRLRGRSGTPTLILDASFLGADGVEPHSDPTRQVSPSSGLRLSVHTRLRSRAVRVAASRTCSASGLLTSSGAVHRRRPRRRRPTPRRARSGFPRPSARRSGTTVPVSLSTDTRPTASPPTSAEPPAEPVLLSPGGCAARPRRRQTTRTEASLCAATEPAGEQAR